MSNSEKMAQLAVKALQDRKSKDVRIIDIRKVSVIADYFIIASGTNTRQIQALADNVEEALGRAGYEPRSIEGYNTASWILMDYNDIIVHIFSEESRIFYDLERIWRDGTDMDVDTFLKNKPQEAEKNS